MNRLRNHRCYLFGPMDDVPDRGTGWRNAITPQLEALGVIVINPCEKPDTFHIKEEDITVQAINSLKAAGELKEARELMKPIAHYDLGCVDRTDFMLGYLDPDVHMCGSYMEAKQGLTSYHPVLTVVKGGVKRTPNFYLALSKLETLFNDFDEAMNYIKGIDNGSIQDDLDGRWKFMW